MNNGAVAATMANETTNKATFSILVALSISHLLNDTMQSLIPSIYPMVKENYQLTFGQIGLITLTFQLTASLLQPVVGAFTDKRPQPFSLAIGMGFTLLGLLGMSMAGSFSMILVAAAFIGLGSSVFHPEASRMAHMASGGRHGMAQSLFQVGGNAGSSFGPLLAALIIVPLGQFHIIWFSLLALLAMIILANVGKWYKFQLVVKSRKAKRAVAEPEKIFALPVKKVVWSLTILLLLIFSKYIYMTSMSSYFTFYLIEKFDVSVKASQLYLFMFLFAVAAGTFLGGPMGDRFGRKYVIWFSILGAAPFTLMLPYASLFWTGVLSVVIGLILSSAFSAILVYAQELVPGKVGMIAGLFFGLAFGTAGVGSALLGELADRTSIEYVFAICSFLPLLGIIAVFLPSRKELQAG
ncbi:MULTISPECIES: MFS transporter [unclassified Imperialibacter]|uniref:MFS transporter n=1 Tax=unclassified Imperialibacter TaxID=2629706 RepID=UPI001257373C|nr:MULTISPECIES: MFS transporter [unclassified Imperialibacter]CAD5250383.1 fosmidomycin efflux system, member of the major facilitator superfamily [Imperialibacter sp. 75]CAD5287152.1 fosmidomycin efflux system, member of the major facilitator superfamily [Imperialibacter sp. 89]VVT06095.1 fosmidomycin efflux system, member of the major facilitator superfamily [Imperialibacter sp. EC-SDR9]